MRPLSVLLALAGWAGSVWVLLVGLLWGLALKCDDSCSDAPGWRENPDAWQWNGLAALGVVAFLAGGALVLFVWRRRPLLAAVAVVVGFAASALLFGGLITSEWIDHLDRRSPGELLLLIAAVFGPIFAVLLTVPGKQLGRVP